MEDYRLIDLNDYVQVGEGGNGTTYVNPAEPDAILKVNNARLSTLENVKHEYDVAKAVEDLGLPVPQVHEIVRVGEAYATITQLIKNKKSLSRICHDEPQRTEEMARLLCRQGKELFATPCNTDFFPNRKEQMLWAIDHAGFVSRKNRKLLRDFVEAIPESSHCLHGDFQSGNLILAGDRPYWIDLDRFAYGDPMFDIGHLFQVCQVYAPMKRVQDIFHMTLDQFHCFWDAFAKEYTGEEDHSHFDWQAGRFACLDIILRTKFVSPTWMEKIFFGIYVRRLVKQYFRNE